MKLSEAKKRFKHLLNNIETLAGYSLTFQATPISQIAEMTYQGFSGSAKDKKKLAEYLERITNYEWRKF